MQKLFTAMKVGNIMIFLSLIFCLFGTAFPDDEHTHKKSKGWEENKVIVEGFEIRPRSLQFGTVFDGEEPLKKIFLTNTGDRPVAVKSIYSGCGCAVPRIVFADGRQIPIPSKGGRDNIGLIPPGTEAYIEVKFVTHGYSGEIHKSVMIKTDTKPHARFDIRVHAKIVKAFAMKPEILDFGDVVRGRETARELVITPKGIGAFSIERFENLPSYMIYTIKKLPPRGDGADGCPLLLTLKLLGDFPLGETRKVLLASIKSERVKSLRIPFKMHVLPKIVFRLNDKTIGSRLDFGVFDRNEGKTLSLDVKNLAPSIPYDILEISVTGPCQDLVETSLETVSKGEQYRLSIRMKPGLDSRMLRGWISILSNHPDMRQKKMRLLGYPCKMR